MINNSVLKELRQFNHAGSAITKKIRASRYYGSQIYGHRTIVPSDYRDMLKFAEVMYQTSGEILEHIKNEAKKKFNDQNKNWR